MTTDNKGTIKNGAAKPLPSLKKQLSMTIGLGAAE